VLPFELRRAFAECSLLLQHLDTLRQKTAEKGDIQQLLDRELALECLDQSS
jgi:hypothetical protein